MGLGVWLSILQSPRETQAGRGESLELGPRELPRGPPGFAALTVLQLVSRLTMLWSKGVTWLEMRTLTR